MAAPAPTIAELMAIITTLQAHIDALQNAAPAAAAAPPAGAATVIFTNTPQMLGANDLIDYLTKQGSTMFKQGCKPLDDKALTDGFAMTPNQTVIFVEAFHHRAATMGWNHGAILPHLPTALVAKLTSSKVMAKLTRPLSNLHMRGSASLGELIPSHVRSRIT